MNKKNVYYANVFAMILLILYSEGGAILYPIFDKFNLPFSMRIVLPQITLLLVPALVFFLITKKPIKETLRLNKIGFKTILLVIAIGLLSMPIASLLSLITQFIFPNRIGQVVSKLDSIPLIVRLGIIALTPAICEEITMRGVVLSGYDNLDAKRAAIMTGLFFGIIHMDGNQFLYTFALGIMFAYLVRITNSIFTSMICHFTLNGAQLVIAEIAKKVMELYEDTNIKEIQDAGLSSFGSTEIINAILSYSMLAAVCIGIIIIIFQKLIKMYGKEGLKPKVVSEEKIKYINWPVYVTVILYILIIANDLIAIYK